MRPGLELQLSNIRCRCPSAFLNTLPGTCPVQYFISKWCCFSPVLDLLPDFRAGVEATRAKWWCGYQLWRWKGFRDRKPDGVCSDTGIYPRDTPMCAPIVHVWCPAKTFICLREFVKTALLPQTGVSTLREIFNQYNPNICFSLRLVYIGKQKEESMTQNGGVWSTISLNSQITAEKGILIFASCNKVEGIKAQRVW